MPLFSRRSDPEREPSKQAVFYTQSRKKAEWRDQHLILKIVPRKFVVKTSESESVK